MATSVPGITAGVGAASKAEADHEKATQRDAAEIAKHADLMRKKNEILEGDMRDRTTRESAKHWNRAEGEDDSKRAASAKEFAVGLGAAAIAVTGFIAALRASSALKQSGASDIGSLKKRLGQAGQDLGMSRDEQATITKRLTSGEVLPGGMTGEEYVQIYEAAGSASAKDAVPRDKKALLDLVNNQKLSASRKIGAAGDIVPGISTSWGLARKTDIGADAAGAMIEESEIDASRRRSQQAGERAGRLDRRGAQLRENALREGSIFSIATEMAGSVPVIGPLVGGAATFVEEGAREGVHRVGRAAGIPGGDPEVRGYLRRMAENTSPPPPSTGAGN